MYPCLREIASTVNIRIFAIARFFDEVSPIGEIADKLPRTMLNTLMRSRDFPSKSSVLHEPIRGKYRFPRKAD
mgnify:CR=1 FL=1